MSRPNIPSREQSPAASKPLLAAVERQLGVVRTDVARTDIDLPAVHAQVA